MKYTLFVLILFIVFSPQKIFAQTEGTCRFTVTTERNFGDYDPRHVLAIWVTDSSNKFIKTLLLRAQKRIQYLYTWKAVSSENVVDAVTGATLNSHETHTVTWDCRDLSNAIVPDGIYRIRVEFTSEHAQGPLTPASHIQFTKGPDKVDITPADLSKFKDMSLSYAPDIETNVLVPSKSIWKYNDTGTNLHNSDWKLLSYDDSSWKSGPGKLGYSDNPATTLNYGPDSNNKYPCYYFRHKFNINYLPESLKVRILRDDGLVVYLNGSELKRDNMPVGQVTYSTQASHSVSGSAESTYFPFTVEHNLLVKGDNILAAEVHQSGPGSSDLGFDLELKASPPSAAITFKRGDTNDDGSVNIADVIKILEFLFTAGDVPACLSTCDTNDDNSIDISDPINLLTFLFGDLNTLPEPYLTCGEDPTADDLTCESFSACP